MKLVVPALALASAATAALLLYFQQQQKKQQQRFRSGRAPLAQYRDAPLALVVDVGSSSVRASCFALLRGGDSDSQNENEPPTWTLLEGSLQQLPLAAIDARGEADIAQLAASVESVLDDALAFLRAAQLTSRLVGVGFSTFAMNLLGVNAAVRSVGWGGLDKELMSH